MDQGAYAIGILHMQALCNERSRHMIFDEIDEATNRDMYFFYRGELKEYMRNHPDLNDSERQQLTAWVKTGLGQSIHSSPLLAESSKTGK